MNSEMVNAPLLDRIRLVVGKEKPFTWAKKVGLSAATFNRVWNQGGELKLSQAAKIAEKTGISLDWLATGKGSMNPVREEEEKQDAYIKEGTAEPAAALPAASAGRIEIDPGVQAMSDVKEVFDSGDPLLVPALRANLEAFKRALRREQEIKQVLHENHRILNENAQMRERLDKLEKRLAALETKKTVDPGPVDPETGSSASSAA